MRMVNLDHVLLELTIVPVLFNSSDMGFELNKKMPAHLLVLVIWNAKKG